MLLLADALRAELAEWRIRLTEVAPDRTRSDLYRQAIGGNASGELHDNYEPLEPTDVADAIAYALNVPDNDDVSRIEIIPIGQIAGGGAHDQKNGNEENYNNLRKDREGTAAVEGRRRWRRTGLRARICADDGGSACRGAGDHRQQCRPYPCFAVKTKVHHTRAMLFGARQRCVGQRSHMITL